MKNTTIKNFVFSISKQIWKTNSRVMNKYIAKLQYDKYLIMCHYEREQ